MAGRALAVVLATALLGPTAVLAAAPAHAAPAAEPAPHQGRLLEHRAHGAVAIKALGAHLPEAAKRNGMSATRLRTLLREDSTLWIDTAGALYYVDPAPAPSADTSPSTAAAAPYPYDQTFLLHSKPGSNRTIYLDFDGQLVSGTAWNTGSGVDGTTAQPAFDTDGDPGTFSQAERDVVQEVWQRVSEDFAPFDVDVTTADPGAAALARSSDSDGVYGVRALITPSTDAQQKVCGGFSSGCAYIGTFDEVDGETHEPAWIFPQMNYSTVQLADTVSHEVGHNLGLEHDGGGGDGEYYRGHNGWAPIMGSGDHPISQWSKGEYASASNTQDDFAVIAANGAPVRPDDHADTRTGATPLVSGDLLTGSGLITAAADKDVFSFSRSCTGPVTVTGTPAPVGPDLDLRLRVLGADGTQLASVDPVSAEVDAGHATGMDATWTGSANQGSTYYLELDGVGRGTVDDGYSDYASVGAYSVSVTGCGKPSSPTDVTISKDPANNAATLAWQPPPAGGLPITGYVVTGKGGNQQTLAPTARSQTITGLTPGASYTFSVAATTSAGTGPAVSRSFVDAVVPPSAPTSVRLDGDTNGQRATLYWSAPVAEGDSPITSYELTRSGVDVNGNAFDPIYLYGSGTQLSWDLYGLAYGTTYVVGITAISDAGRSPTVTRSVTLVQPRAPSAPQGVAATTGTRKATVTWTAPSDPGTETVTYYRVVAYLQDGTEADIQTVAAAPDPQSLTFTGLTGGTVYRFGVSAYSKAGYGTEALSALVTPAAGTLPSAPQNAKAAPGDGIATLTWSAPASTGSDPVTGYDVTVYDADGSPVGFTGTGGTTSATVFSLTNGSSYTFGIRALTDAGQGPEATTGAVVPRPDRVASAPQNVAAAPGDHQLAVTWGVPTDPGTSPVTGYVVVTYTSGGSVLATSPVQASSSRSYTVSGLTNGTSYRVGVHAVTAAGDGGEARTGPVTPVAPVAPSAPQTLAAKPGDRQVALSWTAPASAGSSALTQYAITVYDDQGTTVASYSQAASSRTRTVTGLVNGRAYRFGVRAVSQVGSGTEALTALVTPRTTPGAPVIGTAVSGTTGGTVSAKAVWNAPTTTGGSAVTGYKVTAYRMSSTGTVLSTTTSTLRPASARTYWMTLPAGRYRFAVRAVNVAGASAYSARSNLVSAR